MTSMVQASAEGSTSVCKIVARLLTAVAAAMLIFSAAAAEAVTRHCDAQYVVKFKGNDDKTGGQMADVVIGAFRGRGACGRLSKNKCRSRARDAAIACAMAHGRSLTRPAACTPERGVVDYRIDRLNAAWEKTIVEACCNAWFGPEATTLRPSLVVRVSGDRQCGFGAWNDPSGRSRTDVERVVYGEAPIQCARVADRCGGR